MRLCEECGFDWDTDRVGALAVIAGLVGEYRRRVDLACTIGADIRARPSADVWSVLEYCAHIRDVADFYFERIELVLATERPHMYAVGFGALADERRYNDDDIGEVLDAFDRHTTATVDLVQPLSEEAWRRVGMGSEGGERTVEELARRLAHDGHHHLFDIDRILA